MELFIRRPSKTTPYVRLDAEKGTFVISGRSIPIDAEAFYRPILDQLEELAREHPDRVEFCFKFDFFNIASSKRVLFILYKLAEMQNAGTSVIVRWMYEKFDDDMLEIGKDYSVMIDELYFVFEEYETVRRSSTSTVKL
jgi:hypothetical protein